MHERAAVSAEVERVIAESGGMVTGVRALIGPGVDPGVVRGIWEELTAGTAATSAEILCIETSARLRCLGCGDDYPGSKLSRCPVCGGDGLVIEEPPEFLVSSWTGAG